MRTKNFLLIVCCVVSFSLIVILFDQHKPETLQNIVTSTHEQIRNFKDNLRDAETKTLVADGKYLETLGFIENPRLFPKEIWRNTTLPVIVTYVFEGQESQAIGLINNVARIIPNNTILVYNLGLSEYSLKTLLNFCNNTKCQTITYDLSFYPSHVTDEHLKAYRPLIIQDALRHTGAILFIENNYRIIRNVTANILLDLYDKIKTTSGILTWPTKSKNPVSSLTHKKMFEYFHTDADNFLFLPMVSGDVLLIVNTQSVHNDIMLPWNQCALTQDCIIPIGAQSAGCKFDKKPQYRYSGCHSYDLSALNIALGLKFKLDSNQYTYIQTDSTFFETVSLSQAASLLKELEQNSTSEVVRYLSSDN